MGATQNLFFVTPFFCPVVSAPYAVGIFVVLLHFFVMRVSILLFLLDGLFVL